MSTPTPSKSPRAGLLVLRGAGMRMLAILVNAIGTLAILPIALHAMGDYWFGVWMLIGSIVVQYQILDFGMSQTVVRFLSKRRAEGDLVGAQRAFSTAITAFLGLSAVAFCVLAACLMIIDATIVDAERRDILYWAVLLVGSTAAMSFPTYVLEGSLTAALRQDLASILQVLRAVGRIGFSYWVLTSGYGIVGMAVVTFVTDTIYRLLVWWLQRRLCPEWGLRLSLVSWRELREMLGFGRFVFLANLSKFSLMHSSIIVVSALLGASATAIYSIGINVISRLEGLIRLGFFIAMPAFTSIAVRSSDHGVLRQRFLTVTRVVAFGVSLVGGGLIFAGYDFILAWIGPDYGVAYWPLLILMSAWMLELCQIPALQLMTALGKHRRFAYYDLGVAITSITCACALAYPFGVNGVAVGVGLPVAVSALVFKTRNVCREMQLSQLAYLGQIGRVMGGSLMLQVPVWFLLREMPGMNLLELFVFGCLTYGPLALAVFLVILPASDQRYLVGLLPGRVARPMQKVLPHLREGQARRGSGQG